MPSNVNKDLDDRVAALEATVAEVQKVPNATDPTCASRLAALEAEVFAPKATDPVTEKVAPVTATETVPVEAPVV